MFGDLLTVYEDIVASLDDLNVAELFAPVMVELRRLEDSLVENLGHTSTSFQQLQGALP